jgi:hypothetical protein
MSDQALEQQRVAGVAAIACHAQLAGHQLFA